LDRWKINLGEKMGESYIDENGDQLREQRKFFWWESGLWEGRRALNRGDIEVADIFRVNQKEEGSHKEGGN